MENMLSRIKQHYSADAPLGFTKDGDVSQRELQVAACLVFLDIAHVDGSVAADELKAVVGTMNRLFNLTDEEAGSIIEIAEYIRTQPGKTKKFLDELRVNFTLDQRQLLLAMLWRVVAADGEIEQFEAQHAVRIRESLGLSLEQAVRARQLYEEQSSTTAD